MSLEIRRHIDW